MLGKPFKEVWADVWNDVKPMLDSAMNGVSTWLEDHPFVLHRNGYPEQVYVTFSSSPIHDESGAVGGVFCACIETTGKVVANQQRDKALEELATSTEKLRLAADAAELGLFDHDLRTDEITLSNCTWEHFGLSRNTVLSRDTFMAAIHPDDRERVRRESDAFFSSSGNGYYESEYRTGDRADGKARWIVARGRLFIDDEGKPFRLLGTTMDITERKQVEQRLRLLDAMSETTRSAMDSKIIMVEIPRLLGEYLRATRCAYAEMERDSDRFTIQHDWTSAGAASTVGTYSLDLFGRRAADLRAGNTLVIRDVERELVTSEGADLVNALGIKAVVCCPLVKEGRLLAMMTVHQDRPRNWSANDIVLLKEVAERSWVHIERVRATEALREADRRKTEFLATLAHELRNPLAPIQTGLDVLRLSADSPAAVSKVRDMMERPARPHGASGE